MMPLGGLLKCTFWIVKKFTSEPLSDLGWKEFSQGKFLKERSPVNETKIIMNWVHFVGCKILNILSLNVV